MQRRSFWPYAVLFVGVLIASTASIFIRFAQSEGVASLAIAAWRLAIAAVLLAPLAWLRVAPEIRALSRRQLGLGIASGAFLAVHFASWISSLEYTSVASSAALVATNPLWVGLISLVVFRERLAIGAWFGIGLTLLGTAFIAFSDSNRETSNELFSNPMLGNGLALIGAATVSGYLLIGRSLRRQLSTLAYIWLVYTTAAVVLVVWALLAGVAMFGFSPVAYLFLLALALGPQLLGHTAFNYALSRLSATFIAVSILGEPIGSALLAWQFFGEQFAPLQLIGFVLLLSGIVVASLGERKTKPQPAETVSVVPPAP